ncbi:MAG: aminoglycoside 6-adenylyltransferase [Bacteroidota bacterium]
MRTEEQMIELLLSVAEKDERIRAVLLNGSRANPNVEKDEYQDFDVVYWVDELNSYRDDGSWIDVFGERIILQMPNSMEIGEANAKIKEKRIVYLMLFKDLNRIDLTLVDTKDRDSCRDSLQKVLMDKDQLFAETPTPSEKDHWVKKPNQKAFSDCCNEFWWVSTYVMKGVARKEALYAKEMLENPIRKMFLQLLAWQVGSTTDFSVNVGAHNRFLQKYVSPEMWTKVLKTYPDADIKNIWWSLGEMMKLFHELALELANRLELNYHVTEAENVMAYMGEMENRIKDTSSLKKAI